MGDGGYEVTRIHNDAEAAAAPFEAAIREAVRLLDCLGETRAGIAELTGLSLPRGRSGLSDAVSDGLCERFQARWPEPGESPPLATVSTPQQPPYTRGSTQYVHESLAQVRVTLPCVPGPDGGWWWWCVTVSMQSGRSRPPLGTGAVDEATGERRRVSSAILPLLYLRGLSTGGLRADVGEVPRLGGCSGSAS